MIFGNDRLRAAVEDGEGDTIRVGPCITSITTRSRTT